MGIPSERSAQTEAAIPDWVRELNEQFGVVEDFGGRCVVIDEGPPSRRRDRPIIRSFRDFRIQLRPRKVMNDRGRLVDSATAWLQHQDRRQFRTIDFLPGRELPDDFNLWTGFACPAKPGDYSRFERYLLNDVCRGDVDLYETIFSWFARLAQWPAFRFDPAALVLRGSSGEHAKFIGRVFGSLFGKHCFSISLTRAISGRFNALLAGVLFLQTDATFWEYDREIESKVRELLVSDRVLITRKFRRPQLMRNYMRMLIRAPRGWIPPPSVRANCFVAFDVDDTWPTQATIEAIEEEMNSGGREALLHDLLTHDLSKVNFEKISRAAEFAQTKSNNPRGLYGVGYVYNRKAPRRAGRGA